MEARGVVAAVRAAEQSVEVADKEEDRRLYEIEHAMLREVIKDNAELRKQLASAKTEIEDLKKVIFF